MKREIILKPKLMGCATCSPVPKTALDNESGFFSDGSMHCLTLKIDNKSHTFSGRAGNPKWFKASAIIKKYQKDMDKADCSELSFETPLRGVVYEWDKETHNFYLVEQNGGYA